VKSNGGRIAPNIEIKVRDRFILRGGWDTQPLKKVGTPDIETNRKE